MSWQSGHLVSPAPPVVNKSASVPKEAPMPNVAEVCRSIDTLAPPGLAYSWDKNGLSVGNPNAPVTGIVTALTVTEAVRQKALKQKANLIVSHHPLLFAPLEHLREGNAHTDFCLQLVRDGIACFNAHTNLDVVPGGVNTVLAERVGLLECGPLIPAENAGRFKLVTFVPEACLAPLRDALCRAGAGIIGEYQHCSFSAHGTGTFLPSEKANPAVGRRAIINEEPECRLEVVLPRALLRSVLKALTKAHPYEEPVYDVYPIEGNDSLYTLGLRGILPKAISLSNLAAQLCATLKTTHTRYVGPAKKSVKKVAVLGGSGSSSLSSIPFDIDVVISGDIKYHDALDASQRGLAVIDAGHVSTEKWIVPVLTNYLREQFPKVTTHSYLEPELFHVALPQGPPKGKG